MKSAKTCCFAGHRDPPAWIKAALAESVELHINDFGVTNFLVGAYGGFDRLARSAVIASKKEHPNVKLYLMLAYLPQPGAGINLDGCDGAIFPEGQESVPAKAAIPRLNRRMLRESAYLIAFVTHISGGAYQTLEYARRLQRQGKISITNLRDQRKNRNI